MAQSTQTAPRPRPSVTAWTEPFWAALKERKFLVYRCKTCGACYWPPAYCKRHPNEPWGANLEWQEGSGRGRVFTFNITHWQFHPAFPPPYVYALVELEEGPVFPTNIIGCPPEEVRTGMEVEVVYEDCLDANGETFTLPLFQPLIPKGMT